MLNAKQGKEKEAGAKRRVHLGRVKPVSCVGIGISSDTMFSYECTDSRLVVIISLRPTQYREYATIGTVLCLL